MKKEWFSYLSPGQNFFFYQMNKQRGEFPFYYLLGTGLAITGISILTIFRGASLGILFVLGGIATVAVGYFLEKEKNKD